MNADAQLCPTCKAPLTQEAVRDNGYCDECDHAAMATVRATGAVLAIAEAKP